MSRILSRHGEWVGVGALVVGILAVEMWPPAIGLGLTIYGLIGIVYGRMLLQWDFGEGGRRVLSVIAVVLGVMWLAGTLLGIWPTG